MDEISLNKYIANTGFCSRREADEYIDMLRVTINGKQAYKGNRVKENDEVRIDGEPLKKKKTSATYIILNKPKGVTCTTDLKDKTNIVDYLKYKTRIFPIGRLDKRSEGLLFLTDDGDIVNKILRAGNNHEKEYSVLLDKPITLEHIKTMRSGIRMLGQTTKPCFVQNETPTRIKIILTQGLNRQIRRMCEALGYNVLALRRTRIMNITIKGLDTGKWRYFSKTEFETLQNMLQNSSKTADGNIENMDE
jgi:23S rRNA pseudouridine2604 synthase